MTGGEAGMPRAAGTGSGSVLASSGTEAAGVARRSLRLDCRRVGRGEALSSTAFVVRRLQREARRRPRPTPASGSVDIAVVQGGVTLTSVSYSISGPNSFTKTGTIDVASSNTVSAVIGGLPAGNRVHDHPQRDRHRRGDHLRRQRDLQRRRRAPSPAVIFVTSRLPPSRPRPGSVAVNGTINVCPVADGLSANPVGRGRRLPGGAGNRRPRS